ncbi:MAG TPA: zinc-binding dehydrogenase [candidate division Zixibacteria bacterium]|nr:zinc-binding dehydrogenase [candidate division Zixibacteria bacterium]
MKAVRIHRFGETEDVLQYDEIPVPEPGAGEVLIKVEAAALNRADLGLRKGTYRVAPEDLPIVPGREFAGTIARLGPGVQEFKIGDRVVAYPGKGGYAEYAVARESEVHPIPPGVDAATAASVPTVFLTAWFGLLSDGKLKEGDWLLVQAGSSGVGVAAIQVGKHVGAKAIATSSGEDKCRRLRALGADAAIDYTVADFVAETMKITGGRGADVVLEMIGGDVYKKSLEVLAPGGRLVSIGGAFGAVPDPAPTLAEGRRATRFSITNYLKANPGDFRHLDLFLRLIAENKFKVIIDKTFPLAEARAAQRYLEGRSHFGKIILIP